MTHGAARSAVFLFTLSLLLAAGNYLLSAQAVRRAAASAASTTQLCRLGNTARAQQVTLWEHLVSLPGPGGETPAARARREKLAASFLAYVRSVFAPRDCAAIGGKP
jgi:hypothetical protein